jgi:hypothetical protein
VKISKSDKTIADTQSGSLISINPSKKPISCLLEESLASEQTFGISSSEYQTA